MVPPAASCLDRDALGERRQMRSGLFLENESKRERNHKRIPCQRVNLTLSSNVRRRGYRPAFDPSRCAIWMCRYRAYAAAITTGHHGPLRAHRARTDHHRFAARPRRGTAEGRDHVPAPEEVRSLRRVRNQMMLRIRHTGADLRYQALPQVAVRWPVPGCFTTVSRGNSFRLRTSRISEG